VLQGSRLEVGHKKFSKNEMMMKMMMMKTMMQMPLASLQGEGLELALTSRGIGAGGVGGELGEVAGVGALGGTGGGLRLVVRGGVLEVFHPWRGSFFKNFNYNYNWSVTVPHFFISYFTHHLYRE
jgi:hypothetical protein